MLSLPITYINYFGTEVTETLYFNVTTAEGLSFNRKHPNLQAEIEEALSRGEAGALIDVIDEIVGLAYGTRTEDGRSFVKDPDATSLFRQSAAYEKLMHDEEDGLLFNPKKLVDFFLGVLPEKARAQGEAALKNDPSFKLLESQGNNA